MVAEVVLIGLIMIDRLSPPGDVFENKCWTIYVAVYSLLSRKLCSATSPRVVAEVVLIGLIVIDRMSPPGDVFENKCWTIYVAVYSPLSRKLCLATSPHVVAEVVLIGLHDNDQQADSPLAMFLKLNVEQFMLQCIVPCPDYKRPCEKRSVWWTKSNFSAQYQNVMSTRVPTSFIITWHFHAAYWRISNFISK